MKFRVVKCDYRKYGFPANIFALLIKWHQKKGYNHFAIEFRDSDNDIYYIDASRHGVEMYDYVNFQNKYKIEGGYVLEFDGHADDIYEWYYKHSGNEYGYLQIIGIFLKSLSLVRRNPFRDGPKRMICTELVARFVNEFTGPYFKEPDSVNLKQIENTLNEIATK